MGDLRCSSTTDDIAQVCAAVDGVPEEQAEEQEMQAERSENGNGFTGSRKFAHTFNKRLHEVEAAYQQLKLFDPDFQMPRSMALNVDPLGTFSKGEATRVIGALVREKHALESKLEAYESLARRKLLTPRELEQDDRRNRYKAETPESEARQHEEESLAAERQEAEELGSTIEERQPEKANREAPTRAANREQANHENAQPTVSEEHLQRHAANMRKLEQEFPEDSKALGNAKVNLADGVGEAVISMPNSDAIVRYFLHNPAYLEKLNAMPRDTRAAEIGRLSVDLERPKVILSKAPPPISRLRSSGVQPGMADVDWNDPTIPQSEYNRYRDAQQRGRIRK